MICQRLVYQQKQLAIVVLLYFAQKLAQRSDLPVDRRVAVSAGSEGLDCTIEHFLTEDTKLGAPQDQVNFHYKRRNIVFMRPFFP